MVLNRSWQKAPPRRKETRVWRETALESEITGNLKGDNPYLEGKHDLVKGAFNEKAKTDYRRL